MNRKVIVTDFQNIFNPDAIFVNLDNQTREKVNP